MAAGVHATKAGTRVLINSSPEPFTNWTLSICEDVLVVGGLWTALQHPWVFLALFAFFVVMMIWMLPKLWRSIKKVFGFIGRLVSGRGETAASPGEAPNINVPPIQGGKVPRLPPG